MSRDKQPCPAGVCGGCGVSQMQGLLLPGLLFLKACG